MSFPVSARPSLGGCYALPRAVARHGFASSALRQPTARCRDTACDGLAPKKRGQTVPSGATAHCPETKGILSKNI